MRREKLYSGRSLLRQGREWRFTVRTFPALTTIHQDAALRARTAIRRLEALRDGTPCDAGILIAQFLGAEEHTEAFSYLPMAVSTVLSAWLRCKEHAAVPF